MKVNTALVFTAIVAVGAMPAQGAILYSTPAASYSQNFDTLPTTPENASLGSSPTGWTDDNASPGAGNFSIVGFYLHHVTTQTEGGFSGKQRMRVGAGTANTGAFWSYGASGSPDRALSSLASNTTAAVADGGVQYIGARFTNNTGVNLANFTLEYFGEQWRDGGAATPVAQQLTFEWKVGAASLQDTGFTAASALDFVSPVFANTGSGAAVVGNTAGRVQKGPVTVNSIGWAPGTDLWIRWTDVNDSGNDHGLGIDDLTFSANVPEPTGLSLALLGFVVAGARRRT
jgi:hypothetical protein